MIVYTTIQGDTVDWVCFKYYGSTAGRVVEQVFEANTGLADMGPVLPIGVQIILPEITPIPEINEVRLWD